MSVLIIARSDSEEAIQILVRAPWIASLALAMTHAAPFSRHVMSEACRPPCQSRFAPGKKQKKRGSGAPRGACEPCPRCANEWSQFASLICYAAARFLARRAPAFRRSRWRHSPPAITPMAQPQNRVSSRRGVEVFCPFAAQRLELSTLRADRSFCRSTGDPEPPGSGAHILRARAPPPAPSFESALAKGALCEQDRR
jgi:hypothetical protein